MPGTLNDILPDPISEENERILVELLKRKMTGSAKLAVELLHAMEERFGPAARDVVRDMAQKAAYPPRSNVGEPAEDLRQFCAALDGACVGSHRWQRVMDTPDCIGYHFTRCLWAEIFRELGEPDLGFVMCASDEPAVRAYNHALGFKRTRTLMEGDDLCDHVFYVKM